MFKHLIPDGNHIIFLKKKEKKKKKSKKQTNKQTNKQKTVKIQQRDSNPQPLSS